MPTTTIRIRAIANVLKARGSRDAPGFDACVRAEIERLTATKATATPSNVLDHFVIAGRNHVSFAEKGLLEPILERYGDQLVHRVKPPHLTPPV